MTAVQASPPLDISGTPKVPLSRLVSVELRKMADTRAGMWLLIAIGVITAAIVVIFYVVADPSDRVFANFIGITATPQGFLLPVLGILLVTSEWTQRTALVSFSLTPVRMRLVTAKVIAALIYGAAAIVLALAVAALATLVSGASDPWSGLGLDDVGKFSLLQGLTIIQGLAFGMLFLNSAAAIVSYFVLPIAFSVLTSFWAALADIQPWIDLGTAQTPLFSDTNVTGEQWAQLGTTTLIWIVIPFLVGLWRFNRAEVK